MKKLIALSFLLAFTSCVLAQSTSPRYGITKNQDNTGRALAYGATTITPTSTMVTVSSVVNNKYYNYVTVASSSISPTFTANVTGAYLADKIDMVIKADATGTRTITLGTNFIANAATTQTLAASKQALFRFIFDGSKYVEVARSIQP